MSGLPGNRNAVWDRVLADTLHAHGIRRIVLCPGGRNGLLAMTLHRTPGIECLFHVDERSAGFLALGTILADGRPAAVCTTSGSAVINLLPAMAEAEARGLPLILLTCDRPVSGRMPGEPQTLPQQALCAPLARVQLALPDPLDGSMTLPAMRDALEEALAEGIAGTRTGPVHINIPQWGDYCATEDDPASLPPLEARPGRAWQPRLASASGVRDAIGELGLSKARRGLILAGQDLPISPSEVAALASATGFPVIADICSGLRHHAPPGLLTTADALAEAGVAGIEDADLLVRLGGAPVSPGLIKAVKRFDGPVLHLARHDPGGDFLTPSAIGLPPPGADALALLGASLGQAAPEWQETWQAREAMAGAVRDIMIDAVEWGELAAAAQVVRASGFGALHCANSMSVRLAGLLAGRGDGPARIFSARGVNGTDGTLGLVLGEALAANAPILALVGDQAFTHDLPALANPLWHEVRGAICVMNNAGGGLFDLTAARRIEGYAATMRNPPAIDFGGIARSFGFDHRRCGNRQALAEALGEATGASRLLLIEMAVPPGTPVRDLPRLISAMGSSALAVRQEPVCSNTVPAA
ncbi:2-succinyl-5-enolpyruvyl-6-hydroxy-3-cyclohexene-1-carboxylic-acid synthase [Novosphingobium beihaiensis]|uniref:2-succinyl-5-enolpyruvyl-6-hydroxy-3-cyclohexene-1-carboxylate synthase n=1 Tax=Novosphingobium beihaiensis TaxID=2930389 RepID=A0ABT0BU06_9SPHN|nr:2-succinyl-5-enolpyruvyl-6-hydroxy-3-cyclohexene-1-carboxylic-acid synthase [Novosphingobium beihaiensis]MCJ2188475.1 2-succinyl-5-enolpyruvyl-6-hydroxy-3-cyclohexene-1-carboxylic-acid synthase [Novosphingobium beihaiensis]